MPICLSLILALSGYIFGFTIRLVSVESWSSPMSVLFLAAAIYLYLSFLGWGLSRIALPRTLSQYRAWFAPLIGIMLAAVF
jgi:hypothetical protein